jgi:TetR/AcrR family transcriptional regulator, repressor for uid operon
MPLHGSGVVCEKYPMVLSPWISHKPSITLFLCDVNPGKWRRPGEWVDRSPPFGRHDEERPSYATRGSVMLMDMGEHSTTADSILEAARTAIAERGPGKLTLSAVANAAGISRPTLYRWFPSKDDLLAAITAYEEERFDVGLQLVIDAHRSPKRRLEAALRYLMNYLDESMIPDPIGVDPEYALKSIAESLGPHIEILARLLGDAWLEVPAVRAGALTPMQASELFLRMAYSHYLVPHTDSEVLFAMLRDLAGISGRAARVMTG